ncbi:ABC transporter substrate-binding protein [Marinobacterium zhoushanense]|uniref:ABC transporter substrate-binding protein n=1 Tax=Marinobacterium zhoushanense TaxID=1679163 RepID=A0ABQ1KEL1_9GAMM|nr:ABC transporter ATP-binding protein [Marinobacterium zhoushanense]GGB93279.1 ABC transporter substrate-binding protein [Marinobacterium zhoushanense]
MSSTTLELESVSHSYGNRVALDNVSIKLRPGQFNALLGPNGAGKSTLFALLTRLYRLQQGEILFDGASINRQPRQFLSRMGVVFQQSTLDLDLTVLQNLEYHGALHGLSGRAIRARAAQELEWLGLADRLGDKVRSLNGGHRRRVEIARALLHQPSILLLDEASAGLDVASRQAINRAVRDLCRQRGLTVLWATHLLEEVKPEDPVIILHKGRVLADGQGQALCTDTGDTSLGDLFERLTENGVPAV